MSLMSSSDQVPLSLALKSWLSELSLFSVVEEIVLGVIGAVVGWDGVTAVDG